MPPVEANPVDEYVFNNRYVVTHQNRELLIAGRLLYKFRPREFYKTVFGPIFYHTGVVYENSSVNLQYALRRLTGCRGGLDEENMLFNNNMHVLDVFPSYVAFIDRLKVAFNHAICGLDMLQNVKDYVEAPHPKRMLRMNAYSYLEERGLLEFPSKWGKKPKAFVKTYEFAKAGKRPRCVVDYSPEGSLVMGSVIDTLKNVMNTVVDQEDFRIGRFRVRFIKQPSLEALSTVFRDVIQGADDVIYYHSDDVIGAFNDNGERKCFEMDISSCDASNSPQMFEILRSILQHPALLGHGDALIDQASRKINLVDPWTKHRFLSIQPRHAIEGSGIKCTTVINNLAVCAIAAGIDFVLEAGIGGVLALTEGAWFAGYKVTCDMWDRFQRLTFLKHNPVLNEAGEIVPILNLGVALRTMGQCDWDLPGRGCIRQRAFNFNSGLVRGMCHMGDHSFHDSLKKKWHANVDPVILRERVSNSTVWGRVPDGQVAARYGLSVSEYHSLLDGIDNTSFTEVFNNQAVSAILETDYALGRIVGGR